MSSVFDKGEMYGILDGYTPSWDSGIHITNDSKEIELKDLELSHLKNLIKWGKTNGYNTYHLELELRIRNLELNKKLGNK